MVGVEQILLINTGVSSVVLFVLFLLWMNKPRGKKEERSYLSKDMYKIKENVSDSDSEVGV